MSQQAPVARPPREKAPSKAREPKSAARAAALANPSKRQLTKWQRERRQKLVILYTALGIAAVALLVLGFGYWREMLARPNEAAAEVGDQAIPLHALATRLRPQLMAIDNEMLRVQNEVVPTSG